MIRATMSGSVLLLVLVACAGAPKKGTGTAAQTQAAKLNKTADAGKTDKEAPQIVCRLERPTGSNIPERVCRSLDPNSEEAAMRAQDAMREAQRAPGPRQGN
jgi:hypothetical protein